MSSPCFQYIPTQLSWRRAIYASKYQTICARARQIFRINCAILKSWETSSECVRALVKKNHKKKLGKLEVNKLSDD
jgi:hypothetical protein